MPPRSWTAWPLSADVVPRSGEQIGAEDGADEWTLKRREPQRPSRELEDILMAVTLRVSRDRFEKREWESSQEHEEGMVEEKAAGKHSGSDRENIVEGEGSAEETSQNFLPSAPEDISEASDILRGAFAQVVQDSIAANIDREVEQQLDGSSLLEEGSESASDYAFVLGRPTVSADDERSRLLLRPTIRHTLSRLDELLMALHNARQASLHYASEHTESQSEFEGINTAADDSNDNDPSYLPSFTAPSKAPLEQPSKQSRPGRPPKVLHMPALSAADILESVEPYKKETRGRKRKLHTPLEGESYKEMLVRIARQQKKAIPFTSAPTGYASSSPTKSTRASPQKRGTSAHTRDKRSTRLGLRDWSEILGTAALLGFSPKAIDRATQRCANLFGEGIKMLSLVEKSTSGHEDQVVDYLPSEIPDFDNLDNHSPARSEMDEAPKTRRRPSRGRKSNRLRSDNEMDISNSETDTRTSTGVETTYYCSYKGCSRRKRGFSKKYYLTKHLRDVHKLDKTELRDAQEDSQEEMEGGVHVNGFMKEVKRRTGWRALDGKPRRRKKSRGSVKTEESEESEGGVPKEEELSDRSVDRLDENDRSPDKIFESD